VSLGAGDRSIVANQRNVPDAAPLPLEEYPFLSEASNMRSIVAFHVCTALLFSTTTSFAAADLPAAGSYGFDWLKNPNSVHCEAVSQALIKQFQKCEMTDGSFGGDPAQAYKCKISSHSEYMVYASKAACVKSLETEKSNE
jgi:hypothetical protein